MSTALDPTNPLDYITSMSNVVNSIDGNTFSAVSNLLSGLPTITDLTNGAYGFEASVSANTQSALNQTLFGAPSQLTGGFSASTPQSQGVEGILQGDFNQLIPALTSLGQQAANNQAAAIQSQAVQAQALAASAGGGGGGKK